MIVREYRSLKPEFDLRKTRYYVLNNDYEIFKNRML